MSALQSISDLTRVPKTQVQFHYSDLLRFDPSSFPVASSDPTRGKTAALFRSATPHVTSRTASPRQKPDPETKLGSRHGAVTVRSGVPGHRRPNQIFVVLRNCEKRPLRRGDHIKAALDLNLLSRSL